MVHHQREPFRACGMAIYPISRRKAGKEVNKLRRASQERHGSPFPNVYITYTSADLPACRLYEVRSEPEADLLNRIYQLWL